MVVRNPTALFTVTGAVLIDSPYHIPNAKLENPLLDPDISHLPKLIQTSLKNCDAYLEHWELLMRGTCTNRFAAGTSDDMIEPGS